jgi:pimeloyl-ACP methyl ester carboxylesterase
VSPLLRAAALPGATTAVRLAAQPRLVDAIGTAGERMRARGSSKGIYLEAVARALRPLQEEGSRRAFIQTLRSVIDVHGQRVSARDRLYLLGDMPTLIVWGERDHTIPLQHGLDAHHAITNSRFETLPRAAHFPHLEDPDGLAKVLRSFLEETEPSAVDERDWGAVIGARRAKLRAA